MKGMLSCHGGNSSATEHISLATARLPFSAPVLLL